MAVIAASLALPFAAKFVEVSSIWPYLLVKNHIGLAGLSVFGILFCIYSYAALHDVREHIESNWRKAGYLLEGEWKADWGGRKSHGWNVLRVIGWLALLAFIVLLVFAIAPSIVICSPAT